MTTIKEALEPCPFCGGPGQIEHSFRDDNLYPPREFWHVRASCSYCDASPTGWDSYGKQQERAIDASARAKAEAEATRRWNSRSQPAPSPAPVGDIAGLRGELERMLLDVSLSAGRRETIAKVASALSRMEEREKERNAAINTALATKEFPPARAAFINAIGEEGTKREAIDWLQKQWNETCYLRAQLRALRPDPVLHSME